MKKIFYLGPEDSYSYIVTRQIMLEKEYELVAVESFSKIIENTTKIKNAIGVLPIENSITSDIHENIDYLFKTDVKIFYEAFLRINLQLIGLKDAVIEDIKTVYSHERALAQCSDFIKEHHLSVKEAQSTAKGKELLLQKQDKTIGIIGSKILANNQQLKILQENIGNDMYNMTRFVFVINDNHQVSNDANKASIIFTVPHMPGALAKLLTELAEKHMNVTKIESRPIPGTNWEYQFWIDIENPNGAITIEQLTNLFEKNTLAYKIAGIYPSGEIFAS
jgi:chorismate mutase/prephenate dehydratase